MEAEEKIDALTNRGESLKELSKNNRVLLVFLRQFGCPFCREAMTDIQEQKDRIRESGTRIVLVHMASECYASQILDVYGIADLSRIADPEQVLYNSFGLKRGNLWQIFGLKVWFRMLMATFFNGHILGKLKGDQYQMPGVFLLDDGEVKHSFFHKFACDRPEYTKMVSPQGEVSTG